MMHRNKILRKDSRIKLKFTTKGPAQEKVKDDAPKLSAKEAFRAFVYDTLKNVFSLTARDDGDINVNIDNVTPLMKALELDTKDEAYIDMVHEACIESFGNININEFDETIMEQRRRTTGEEFDDDFRSAFRLIDIDGDGVISVQDLYQLMMGIGEMLTDDELSELLKGADADGDGEVSYKDFRFFLTGEVLEEDIEPENEDVEDETENVEPEPEVEADNTADEVKPEEEEKPEELTKEEEETRAQKEVTKRKSLLWAFASQKYEKPVETKIPDLIKEIKKEEKHDIIEEEDKKDVDNDNEIESEPKPVTSVTVNYLESVKETDIVEHVGINQNQRNAALRRQSFSAMTSVDSGFDGTDAEDIQSHVNDQSESVTDDGFCSRATSARSRLTHDKSRISSAKSHYSSRPSTAKSIAEESFQDSEQSNELFPNGSDQLGRRSSRSTIVDVENESDEESAIADDCEFDTPLTERQLVFLKQREEQQIYCELGIERKVENIEPRDLSSDEDSLDLESVSQYDPNEITPRVNLSLLKTKHKKAVPILERSRSATRLRTFKKIQKAILVRQNTDPRMNVEHIRAANERFVREQKTKQQKTNTNGLYCTHISLDLNVEKEESQKSPKPKMNPRYNSKNAVPLNTKVSSQQTSLRMLLKRPQTAMTYREAEKLNIVYGKNYDLNSPRSNFGGEMKIVDLAKCVTIDTGSIERPGLAHHHHGYKSVLPLGRVLSGYKSKINQGNGIILNSISRKLERIDYFTNLGNGRPTTPPFSQSMSTKQVSSNKQFSRSISTQQVPQRQSVINLEIPEGARLSCRRQTQYTRFTSKPLIRT
ncbi:uncharacterized protein LOC134691110 isoform X2 [Mytilus trossulus]|uniref:uncharacterized protein LOC134691110 isoform X2 n=1 Tax=Mytilus trossulus TaxID=6551 RepID=UPI0030074730